MQRLLGRGMEESTESGGDRMPERKKPEVGKQISKQFFYFPHGNLIKFPVNLFPVSAQTVK